MYVCVCYVKLIYVETTLIKYRVLCIFLEYKKVYSTIYVYYYSHNI